ncbi:MAG: chemotaxis protein CheW [Desulfuromonadales bacterium]|nr:chemotaxis protein CheW [Desulfuromonadales bacterium]
MTKPLQIIVFALDERRYALHLAMVLKTVRMVEITPLPKAPEMVLGVINFHGVVVPVLNMRQRFRLPGRIAGLGDQLIIARTARRLVALVVDGVSDVVSLPPEQLVDPAGILPRLEHVEGVALLEGGMVFIHDLDAFLSLDEEQALEAAIGGVT